MGTKPERQRPRIVGRSGGVNRAGEVLEVEEPYEMDLAASTRKSLEGLGNVLSTVDRRISRYSGEEFRTRGVREFA